MTLLYKQCNASIWINIPTIMMNLMWFLRSVVYSRPFACLMVNDDIRMLCLYNDPPATVLTIENKHLRFRSLMLWRKIDQEWYIWRDIFNGSSQWFDFFTLAECDIVSMNRVISASLVESNGCQARTSTETPVWLKYTSYYFGHYQERGHCDC